MKDNLSSESSKTSDNIQVIIEESGYAEQHKVQRTIVDLIDVETGEYVDADEILTDKNYNDKAVFAKMRETLILAQKTGVYKYICAICNQPVRLNSRHYGGCDHISNFFSHFSYSDECPAKISTSGNIVNQTDLLLTRFKRSFVHDEMAKKLAGLLTSSSGMANLQFANVESMTRCSETTSAEIEFTFKGIKVGVDFQLYTTFVSKILEKSLRVKKQRTCSMWLFPFFSPTHQEMCAKDIYYGNRRNVFVFDSRHYYTDNVSELNSFKVFVPQYSDYKYAQEESEKAGKLMLNCFWQIPAVKDGRLQIGWRHKLVAFDELTFDRETGDVFYYDSDKEFENSMDPELYNLLLKWKDEIKLRWESLEKIIDKKPSSSCYIPIETKDQKKKNHIMSLIERGQELSSFYDYDTCLYGYKVGDDEIIPPRYYEAGDFDANNIAIVKQTSKGKYGAINIIGKKVINNQFTEIVNLLYDIYLCKNDKGCSLFSISGGEILNSEALEITKLTAERLIVHDGSREYIRYRVGTDHYGSPRYDGYWKNHDSGYKIIDLNGNVLTKNYKSIKYLVDDYVLAEDSDQSLLLDTDGNVISADFTFSINENRWKIETIENECVFVSRKGYDYSHKSKIISFKGETIFESYEYDKILPFDESTYAVFNSFGRGLISRSNFKLLVSERQVFDDGYVKEWTLGWSLYNSSGIVLAERCAEISRLDYGYFKIVNYNSKSHIIDECGEIIVRSNYSSVEPLTHDRFLVQLDFLSARYGVIGKYDTSIVPVWFDDLTFEDNLFKVCRNGLTGTYSYDGERIGDNLTSISDEHNKLRHLDKWALADRDGHPLSDYVYDDIQDIKSDLYVVRTGPSNMGCLDKMLNTVVECEYDQIEILDDGNIKVKQQNKSCVLNRDGQKIISRYYNLIKVLENGDYQVENYCSYTSNLFGVFSNDGKEIVPFGQYDSAEYVGYGYEVCKNHAVGLIDLNGNHLPSNVESLNEQYSVGDFLGMKALITDGGQMLTEFKYANIRLLTEDVFLVQEYNSRKKWGLISNKGEELLECNFDEITCVDGFINVKINKNIYKLNNDYKVLPDVHSTVKYDIERYENIYTIKNKQGDILHSSEYEMFVYSDASNFIIKKGGYGIIDEHGNILMPCKYKNITRITDSCFLGVQPKTKYISKQWGVITRTIDCHIPIILNKDNPYFSFEADHVYDGIVVNITKFGVFVEVKNTGTALLQKQELDIIGKKLTSFSIGDKVKVRIKMIDFEKRRATLELME